MGSQERLFVATSILAVVLGVAACSKPAAEAAPSDTPALLEPASASAADLPASSSSQIADNAGPSPPADQGRCHQVQVGGGWQPGVNGGPATLSQGERMTVCSAPSALVAGAPAAAATPTGAAADTD